MMTPVPFGFELPAADVLGQWVLRVLAVAGAAALGGFVVGLVTQGLSRLLTTRPVPRVPLQVVRVLGAVVTGWAVALLLFGGPGGGLGGGPGWWPFGGPSGGGGGATGKEPPPPAATGREGNTGRDGGPRDSGKVAPAEGETLQVEVLPEYPAVYRVQTPEGPRKFKFEDLTPYLLGLKKATPPLKEIQVSEESSDRNAPAVTRLIDWANGNGLIAGTARQPGQGP